MGHKKIPETFFGTNDHLKKNGFHLTKSNIEKYEISNAFQMT